MRQKRTEFFPVERFVVGVLRRDAFHPQMFHDMVVQGLVARFLADLDHARNLVRLALAHEVGDGGVENQNFKRGDAAFLVYAFELRLRHDAFE